MRRDCRLFLSAAVRDDFMEHHALLGRVPHQSNFWYSGSVMRALPSQEIGPVSIIAGIHKTDHECWQALYSRCTGAVWLLGKYKLSTETRLYASLEKRYLRGHGR